MWDKIVTWGYKNSVQITWFLIGLFTAFGIRDIEIGNWIGAGLNLGLAYINYLLRKV